MQAYFYNWLAADLRLQCWPANPCPRPRPLRRLWHHRPRRLQPWPALRRPRPLLALLPDGHAANPAAGPCDRDDRRIDPTLPRSILGISACGYRPDPRRARTTDRLVQGQNYQDPTYTTPVV